MNELLISLLAGGFALGGSMLGSFLTRTNEHKQWLRNEKIRLYSEYLDMFGNVQIANVLKAIDDREPEEEIFEFYNRVHELCMRVILVAPGEIVEEVQKTMESIGELQTFAGNLSAEMNKKYFHAGQSEEEVEAAQGQMMAEIMEQLTETVESHAMDGYARLERVTNLMRDDLQVADSVHQGLAARLGIRKSDG